MGNHPDWLRFQAYLVGLPKTGSTSVATMFANYRSGHEWQLLDLIGPAVMRAEGELDDAAFWEWVGPRLASPSLEMDSATCHHLYADLLVERFRQARFVHTIRDVRSWANSLLDMVLRKRLARTYVNSGYDEFEVRYLGHVAGVGLSLDPNDTGDDRSALEPLMIHWSNHLRRMAEVLPAERTMRVRTPDLRDAAGALAAFVGVPERTLRLDLSHVNRAEVKFDRFAAFDGPWLRALYAEHCSELMAELFPAEHEVWERRALPPPGDWADYYRATDEWVIAAVREYGPAAAR